MPALILGAALGALSPTTSATTIVDVDATGLAVADGTPVNTLSNSGTAGNFSTISGTVVAASHPSNNDPGVQIQGLGFNGNDKMTAAQLAPAVGLSGNQVHTVRAWVFNPSIASEETIVAWGRRGGPTGSNMGFHSGTDGSFGAVGHWGSGPDVPYGNQNGTDINNTAGSWANLAYTFDGNQSRVFIDGLLSNTDSHGALNVHAESNPVAIGAENNSGDPFATPIAMSGTIARVEVLDTVMTDQQILDAFNDESPYFFDGVDPTAPPVAVDDVLTMRHGEKVRLDAVRNDTGAVQPSSLQITSGPSHGNAVAHPDGTIFYEHTSGTPATDTLTYQVDNFGGTLSSTATVTINFTTALRFDSDFAELPATAPPTAFSLEDAFPGLTFAGPHALDTVPGDTRKLFVTEEDGRVYLIPDITLDPATKTLVLDITSLVDTSNLELALKGIAVHPDWANNGYIYLTYNTVGGRVRLARFTCSTSAPYTANPASILVMIDQDADTEIHTIGLCKFGPDGYLYVSFGDDGNQSDSGDNSQHIDRNFWTSIIRIDVDKKPGSLHPNPNPPPGADPGGSNNDGDLLIPRVGGGSSGEAHYAIPPDNPFVGVSSFNGIALSSSNVRTEIAIMGQRNPWSFALEDNNGDGTVDEIWVGDVGRGAREELTVYPFPLVDGGGLYQGNGGWGWRESTLAGVRSGDLLNGAPQSAATLMEPLWSYNRGGGPFEGNCIIAGFVYRGTALPDFTGKFIVGDYMSGNIWTLDPNGGAPIVERLGGETGIVDMELDPANGDILILDRGAGGFGAAGQGSVKRLTINSNDSGYPSTLTESGFFADLSDLTAQPGSVDYTPNLRFWSDFAEKKRWFLLKDSTDTVGYSQDNPWSFPDGMIWAKHFDMPTEWETFTRIINGVNVTDRRPTATSPRRRLETRFIIKNAGGAYGVSYRWENINGGSQAEANLADNNGENFNVDITVDSAPSSVTWQIPSRSACLICHTPQAGHALSFNTRQLNAPGNIGGAPGNFIDLLDIAGYITGPGGGSSGLPRHLRPDETQYSLEARVRSYLDVNCAYCHRSGGTGAGVWDGRGHLTLTQTGLINGPLVETPVNPGDLLVIPGNVNGSVVYNRAAAANGYSRMPPLATTEIDLEAAQLIADWIASEVQPYTTYQEWRIAHFGNDTSPEGAPTANPDGDEGSNNFEWLTNTDPNDPTGIWRPTILGDGNDVTLEFEGLGNRRVSAYHSTNMLDWFPWPVSGNDGIPLNPDAMHTLSGTRSQVREFYRFQVEEN